MAHIITEKRRLSSVFWMMLMTVSLQLYAQDTFKIKGRILEKTEQGTVPLYSASVALLNTDSILVTGTVSDDKGKFQLDNVSVGNYFVKLSFIGYETVNIPLTGFNKNLDLGDIELLPDAAMLSEVTVTGSSIARKVDRMLVFPSKEAVKHSYDPYDLIANMQIPNLFVNRTDKKMEAVGGGVQIRINGVKATQEEFLAIPAKDITRVEVIDNPGIKYGEGNIGTVVDIIVKRNSTGGLANIGTSFCPFNLFMNSNASLKLNHKKSQWGFYYQDFLRDSKKTWTDIDERFNLGNTTLHRIQKGQYSRNKVGLYNFSLTYNLFMPDNYTLNVAFRNELQNVPYGGTNAELYSERHSEPTFLNITNDRKSYAPSLDVYFKKQFKNNQEIQVNAVGTLIDATSNRRYNEHTSENNLADIGTKVESDKKSIFGEAIYNKSSNNLVFSAGVRHIQAYAHNKYLTNNVLTPSSMNQANSSAFVDMQGKIKGLGYMLSLGGTRSYFKEGNEGLDYTLFTPTLRVNFVPHKNAWMQYLVGINSKTPSLSSLTNVEQMVDTIQIQRGNPNLRSYRVYNTYWTYSYNRNILSAYLLVQYQYYDNPIMEEFFAENNKLIRTEANQRYYQYGQVYTALSLRNIKWGNWSWNAQINMQFSRHWSKGERYNHTRNFFMIGGNTSLNYKNFGFYAEYRSGGGQLYGETITKYENLFSTGINYTHKNLRVSASILYPFGEYKNGSERISKIAPQTLWNFNRDVERQLSISIRYRFGFGKEFKERNRQAGYTDKDTGVMKY